MRGRKLASLLIRAIPAVALVTLSFLILIGYVYLAGIKEGYRHFEVRKCWIAKPEQAVVCYEETE